MSDYTLYHADCLDILPTLEPQSVVIADVPYGNKTYATDEAFPPRVFAEWVARHRTVALFGYPELLVRWCVQAQIAPDEWVTWWPTNKNGGKTARLPKECETIAIFGDTPGARLLSRPRVQDRTCLRIHEGRGHSTVTARMGDVWRDAAPGMGFNSHLRKHPNEKPLSLIERLVTLCSNGGDVVIDPCMGSGTTGHACGNLGRRFIGIEKDAGYYAIAEERIATAYAPLRHMHVELA